MLSHSLRVQTSYEKNCNAIEEFSWKYVVALFVVLLATSQDKGSGIISCFMVVNVI